MNRMYGRDYVFRINSVDTLWKIHERHQYASHFHDISAVLAGGHTRVMLRSRLINIHALTGGVFSQV